GIDIAVRCDQQLIPMSNSCSNACSASRDELICCLTIRGAVASIMTIGNSALGSTSSRCATGKECALRAYAPLLLPVVLPFCSCYREDADRLSTSPRGIATNSL